MIQRLIYIFLILIAGYHIIGTSVIFGLNLQAYNTDITLIRDLCWLIIVCISCIKNWNKIIPRIQKNKYIIRTIIGTILLSVIISLYMDKSIFNIFVGLKYDFMFTLIFLSASLIGFANDKPQIEKYIKLYIGIIICGYIRQAARLRLPSLMHRLGYGPVGDFVFGNNPPIYYRTGPGGYPRLQGIFAGPNNYAYFLIAVAPIIYTRGSNQLKKIHKSAIGALRIAIILTLSRGALIGGSIGIITTYWNKIQYHKKRAISIVSIGAILIGGLSIIKWGSTVEHIQNKIHGIQTVIQQPLGYGLGSAGPAIHHEGKRLPENFYLQIMIDIGTIGFILRCLYTYLLIKQSKEQQEIYSTSFLLGRYSLMIMGLFLHVFEDSMVNYLFFVPYGLRIGYNLQKNSNL